MGVYMTFGQNYKIDEGYFVEVKPGEYMAKIASITERQSKSGKPMLELKLRLENGGLVSYYLVDDQSDAEACIRTNQRITKFFDCFRIKRGNFNIKQWQGAKGRVKLDYGRPSNDGSVYIEVKNLILPSKDAIPQGTGQHMQNMQGMQNRQGMQQKPASQGVQNRASSPKVAGSPNRVSSPNGAGRQAFHNQNQQTYEEDSEEWEEDYQEDFENERVYEAPQKNKEGKTIDDIPFEPYTPCYKTEVEGGDPYSHSEGYEEPEIY